jgi:phosphohistidine swiveling domain-containing protein
MSTRRPNNLTAYQPGQPIPTSPDFPIQWPEPALARRMWTLDKIHFGRPLPPLAAEVWQRQIAAAFNVVAGRYELPIRLTFLYLNGYLYNNYQPVGLPPEAVLKGLNWVERVAPGPVKFIQQKAVAKMTHRYMARLQPVINKLSTHWENEWQPELQQHLAWWDNFDLPAVSLPGLLAHLDESLNRLQRVWDIHFQIIVPTFLALNQFDELYRHLLGEAEPLAAFKLAQGFDHAFLQADRALWELSRQARTMPVVVRTLSETPAPNMLAALEASPEGQIFGAELRCYLQRYGRRGQYVDGLAETSWLEDPTPVIQNLKDMLSHPDCDLVAERQAQAADREAQVEQAYRRLQSRPPTVQQQFETALKAAQTAAYLHEEHNFWIDQQAMFCLRRVFLELGRRLAHKGLLSHPGDIFYLTLAEARESSLQPTLSRTGLIQPRRDALAHFSAAQPPEALGVMPLVPLPDDPFTRTFSRIFGSPLLPSGPAAVPSRSDTLSGNAAAPGVARGLVRVIHTLEQAGQLQAGEILVARATLPPWTPFFATAAAVVTEVGGILSHSAIMAREYGIPAVLGVSNATTLLATGQKVEVDGSAGVVRLLD